MSAAFPLLRALGKPPQLTEININTAAKVHRILFGEGLKIPMNFIGSCKEYGDDMILIHVPGLPGAFPVSKDELNRHKLFFITNNYQEVQKEKEKEVNNDKEEISELGLLCTLEAIETGIEESRVLDHLISISRKRLASLRGTEILLKIGSRINDNALKLSFPYHYGNTHASKKYFDITPEVCKMFDKKLKHGIKLLSRFGVAVFVGIANEESFNCPVPFWNPLGAPAAILSPMFTGSFTIPVGEIKLDYNGPISNSIISIPEDPVRYLNPTIDGKYDISLWLNEGLFGVKVGQPLDEGCVVHGICYNKKFSEFELHVREIATGEIRPTSFCLLPPIL